jgi:hypothetical protein
MRSRTELMFQVVIVSRIRFRYRWSLISDQKAMSKAYRLASQLAIVRPKIKRRRLITDD